MSDLIKILGSIVKQLEDFIPSCIWLGIFVFIIVALWIKKWNEIQGIKKLAKNKIVKRAFWVVLIWIIGCSIYTLYNKLKTDISFVEGEIGIYICNFADDKENMASKSIESALKGNLEGEFDRIKIFRSCSEKTPGSEDEVFDMGTERNAAIMISGQYIKGDRYWFTIHNIKLGNTVRTKNSIELNNTQIIVQKVINEISKIGGLNNFQENKERLSELFRFTSNLQYQNEEMVKRIKKLETLIQKSQLKQPTPSQSKTKIEPKGTNWALLIGIGDYRGPGLSPLIYPRKDVNEMRERLLAGGYEEKNLIKLLDAQASKGDIQNAIDLLIMKTKPQDKVLIYYSGHTIHKKTISGDWVGILCPSNFKMSAFVETGISLTQLKEYFDLIPSKFITFIVDSCFSGLLGVREMTTKGTLPREMAIVEFRKTKYDLTPRQVLLDKDLNYNRIVLTAGKADQVSVESIRWGHGLLTYYVLEGLKGRADLNDDGIIMADELFIFLYPEVVIESDGMQTPHLFGWGTASIPIFKLKK